MRVFKLLLFLVVVAVAALAYVVLVPFGPQHEVFVDIAPHTGTVGIASALERNGVVRSRWVFAALREIEGGSLKAGEYRFAEPASMLTVYDRLERGDVFTVELVIPEGFNLFDIAGAVQAAGLGSREAFLRGGGGGYGADPAVGSAGERRWRGTCFRIRTGSVGIRRCRRCCRR